MIGQSSGLIAGMTILDDAIQHIEHLLEDLTILLQEGTEAAATIQLAPPAEPQTKTAKAVKAGKGSKTSPQPDAAQPSDDFSKANLQVCDSSILMPACDSV